MWKWQIIALCALMGVVLAEDRWVWSTTGRESKARRIPGYVPTTPEPPITTFRPSIPLPSGRGSSQSRVHNDLPGHSSSFFPSGFLPIDFFSSEVPKVNDDGTTKSRITADTAIIDHSSGATLTANDKYTTLDRLQRERGPAPAFPPPKRHQLGGLHPDEVFYADDDLLIIRGGGFHSDAFQEPLQTLDEDVEEFDESTRVDSSVSPPSSNQEYNGNIPSILPPPTIVHDQSAPSTFSEMRPSPFSIFVGGSSNKDYILVPFVEDNSLSGNKAPITTDAITHNHLSKTNGQSSTKLRRAASTNISYRYRTPASTFQLTFNPENTRFQPYVVGQNQAVSQHHSGAQRITHQQRPIRNPAFVHHQPVHQQRINFRPVSRPEPLIQYQPVPHAAQIAVTPRPVIPNHEFHESGNIDLGLLTAPSPAVPTQPHGSGVVLSLRGDTRVNYLPPFPRRETEAEIIPGSFSSYHQRRPKL